MNFNFFCIVFFVIFTLASCGTNKKKEELPEIKILPYKEMLLGEIKLIAETPLAIYQFRFDGEGRQTDSTVIDRTLFNTLAANFYEPDIAQPDTRNNYIEKSFEDLNTKMYNFSYETNNSKLPVKNIILSFNKGDQSRLKSLQITKAFTSGNRQIQQQLYWKSNQYFTISTFTYRAKT
jgi:hypothetical protein